MGEQHGDGRLQMCSLLLWRVLLGLSSANTFSSDKPKDLAFITSLAHGGREILIFILFFFLLPLKCHAVEGSVLYPSCLSHILVFSVEL